MTKREEQGDEQGSVLALQSNNLTQSAIQEDDSVDTDHEYRRNDEHRPVDLCPWHEPTVEQVHRIEEGQVERMTDGLEMDARIRHREPCPAVVARHHEAVGEQRPEATAPAFGIGFPMAVDEQIVQNNEDKQRHHNDGPLLLLDLEYLQRICHFLC